MVFSSSTVLECDGVAIPIVKPSSCQQVATTTTNPSSSAYSNYYHCPIVELLISNKENNQIQHQQTLDMIEKEKKECVKFSDLSFSA